MDFTAQVPIHMNQSDPPPPPLPCSLHFILLFLQPTLNYYKPIYLSISSPNTKIEETNNHSSPFNFHRLSSSFPILFTMSRRTTTLHKNMMTSSQSNPSSTDSSSKPPSDLTQPYKPSFIVKHLSNLNLTTSTHKPHKQQQQQSQTKHKLKHKQQHPCLVDARLQAKAMTTSTIVESSKYSLLKPNHETDRSIIKRTSREKPKSYNNKGQGLLLKNNEKKDCHNNTKSSSMVEDVIKSEKYSSHDFDVIKRSSSVSNDKVASGGWEGRRRSFSVSEVDLLGDVFAINGAKMVSADMPPFMQIHAVDCARKAFDSMEKFTSKTLALSLKKVLLATLDSIHSIACFCWIISLFEW
ncbi:hypothetical protein RIF29_06992 [Crotalaria pallida]|uniref:Uncharacterized protein n=1 Tax=Crotalaria pallida TaxID=3830 RepID=A0AAN9J3X6_CROPI